MKAKKSILGLILVIGMLLSCVGASYADTATAAPKFTTTRLESANHGDPGDWTIEVSGNTDSNDDYVNVEVAPAVKTVLEGTYKLTVGNNENGALTLKADELTVPTPSAGYKFKVTATNEFSKTGSEPWQKGTTTKEFTLKILALDPVISSPETDTDISDAAGGDDSAYPFMGTEITAVEITVASASPKVNMTATGLPKGLTFAAKDQPTTGSPADTVYEIKGTPTEYGSFKIKVTAANADSKLTSKKSTANYTMEVLGSPDISPSAFKEATFGKAFNQSFTVTGMTKNVPLKGGSVTVGDEDTDYGIKGEYNDGKFTVSGTVDKYNEFGSAATESFDVTFNLISPADPDNPVEITIPLTVKAVAPSISAASKTAAQTAAAALKKGEEGTITIEATGPGDIEWEVGTLPDGLESGEITPDTENMKSTFTITGTPTVTAKNYGVDVTAKNGAGSTKVTLKLTIDSDPPTITLDPDVSTAEGSDYAELPVNSGDVTIKLTADTGAVTWKVTNLPKGLSLVLTDEDFNALTDKKVKTSQYAVITGKPTAAMKEGKYITVTATDPNLKKSSDPVELKGVMVYAAPTIKTTKLPDIKIGTAYSATIKTTGATECTVTSTPALPEEITVASSDGEITFSGTLNEVPTGENGNVIKSLSVVVTASGPGGDTSVTIPVTIKGDAPKFATSSLSNTYTKAGEEANEITIKGANPITVSAYISANDAKSAGIGTTKIDLGDDADSPETNTGFYISVASDDSATTVTLAKAADTGGSFKKLGVTIEATNAFGTTTKVFKADMTGEPPAWTIAGVADGWKWAEATEIDSDVEDILKNCLYFTAKDAGAVDLTFTASGDNITLTASPNRDTNGLKIAVDDNAKTVTVTSTAESTAKSTKLTLTAKNAEGQKKITVTLNGQEAPVINEPSGGYSKEVETGKKLSLALSLKSGTKPIWWIIDNDAGDGYITAEKLAEYGITLDEEKGKLEGTTTKATLSDGENPEYTTVKVMVYAENGAGSSDKVPVEIGVMGSKPKLAADSKSFTFTRGEALEDDTYQLAADGIEEGVVWKVAATGNKKDLNAYVKGLELAEDGTITGTPTEAGKNISVPVTMNHYGNEQKASVKFTVVDPKPVIDTPDTVTITGVTKEETKDKVAAAKSGTITVALTTEGDDGDTTATGTSKITWKATKPSDNRFTVKIENAKPSDTHYNTAKITVTLAKGKTITEDEVNDGIATSFTLTATNSGRTEDKISDAVTVNISVNGASVSAVSPEEQTIGEARELEDDIATNDELTKELGEGELTIGTERTVGMLTDAQAKVLDDGRFVIAAILPEVSATADGQYGLEVDIAENVKAGAKLYWFAFPKDAASSEDDTIIDFFDVSGTDTEVVPEDHTIVAYPWFREGVTYGPVIAVKAEDAESGEAVTEGELEETAESEAESETKEVEVSEPAEETEEAQETETEETETTETTEE